MIDVKQIKNIKASDAITQAGTSDVTYTTPLKLANWWVYIKATAAQWVLTFLAGSGNRIVQVDGTGAITAPYSILDMFVTDSDLIAAATGATYNSTNHYIASVTPANSKVFAQGTKYMDTITGYGYEAIQDNILRRTISS